MPTDLKVPSAGESVTTVQIGNWLKKEGDYVRADESVVELETDKAGMDVPAPVSGRITKLLAPAGTQVKVGDVIAHIDESAAAPAGGAAASPAPAAAKPAPTAASAPAASAPAAPAPAAAAPGDPRIMPAARRVAAEAGVDPAQVPATGPGGRVLKEDVQRFVSEQKTPARPAASAPAASAAPSPSYTGERHEEAVPMTPLRKKIAERLVQANTQAALLTTFNEIDMGAVLDLRKQRGESFEKRYGVKLGFMSFFVKAAIDALRSFPAVNAEIRDGHIVYKDYYDISVAVSTERGLVTPVVRNAERMSFAEVEKAINALAQKARENKLTLDDLQGGTFTISNGGVFGSLMSTPIVNPPQSAILGLHATQERPVVRDGQIVIRSMMYVALTYDHRIIDGRESVSFLKRIKECIEDPTRMLIEV
ncbi:MAG: 2-oxoglutarate dehydrogenase complex dihydrolipoyllysine-residue succinyltransferase [Phycisphaerae bacterium]|nr:2-oxoglutarate dehydrogenase complex dihydrolipoyllysine-residue succinyltransferase [Phycisphaerae bacterium]